MVTGLLCALADGIRENLLIFSLCDVQWEALGFGGLYENSFGMRSICTEERLWGAIDSRRNSPLGGFNSGGRHAPM